MNIVKPEIKMRGRLYKVNGQAEQEIPRHKKLENRSVRKCGSYFSIDRASRQAEARKQFHIAVSDV